MYESVLFLIDGRGYFFRALYIEEEWKKEEGRRETPSLKRALYIEEWKKEEGPQILPEHTTYYLHTATYNALHTTHTDSNSSGLFSPLFDWRK